MSGPFNGKTAMILQIGGGIAIAAFIGYWSGQVATERRMGQTETALATVNAREQSHFDEIQRTLDRNYVNSQQQFDELKSYLQFIVRTGADAKTGEPYRIQQQRQGQR